MTGEPQTWRDMHRDNPEYFDTGPTHDGYPEPVETPVRFRRGGTALSSGDAFAAACTFFLRIVKDDAAWLVHGTIDPAGAGQVRAHAWVELPDDLVWDGATHRFYAADAYRESLRSVSGRRYTRVEAARLLLREGHPGPWAEADIGEPE